MIDVENPVVDDSHEKADRLKKKPITRKKSQRFGNMAGSRHLNRKYDCRQFMAYPSDRPKMT